MADTVDQALPRLSHGDHCCFFVADPGAVDRMRLEGGTAFLEKPVTPEALAREAREAREALDSR